MDGIKARTLYKKNQVSILMVTRHTTPDNYNQRSYSLVNMQREKDAYISISHTKRKTAQADEVAQLQTHFSP